LCMAFAEDFVLFASGGGRGPNEFTAFALSGGSVQSDRVTDKAENALCVIIAGSEEIVCLILFVFFPLTLIQSSLRPSPRHSSSSNLYRGTKGISITSLHMRTGDTHSTLC